MERCDNNTCSIRLEIEMMVDNSEISKDPIVAFVEKWWLITLINAPQLLLSFKITSDIISPPADMGMCGTGFIALAFGQILFAIIAFIVSFLKMFLSKTYTLKNKIIIALIIFIPSSVPGYILFF